MSNETDSAADTMEEFRRQSSDLARNIHELRELMLKAPIIPPASNHATSAIQISGGNLLGAGLALLGLVALVFSLAAVWIVMERNNSLQREIDTLREGVNMGAAYDNSYGRRITALEQKLGVQK